MAQKEFSVIWSFAAKFGNNFFGAFSKMSSQMSDAAKSTEKYANALGDLSSAGNENAGVMARMTNAVSKYIEKIPLLNKMTRTPRGRNAIWAGLGEFATTGAERLYNASMNAARGLFEASRGAMEFESAMADVRKVVDFESADQFKAMSKDILDLSTRIPMAKEGLAQIVAAGGQSGIAREDLLAFAEAAAKMGVAFDITADQAGEMMAKWRTAFKMDQNQVVALADQINYLGNTTAASAPKISEVVTRIGPLGEIGGVAAGEIAALGASMVGAGVEEEIAATGIKNLILAMTAGESATAQQKKAFQSLGFEAEDMAARMQTDARGAILDLFATLQTKPKEAQGALLSNIVGKESIAGLSTLMTNLGELRGNFEKVGDASKYAGSMQAEYDERSKTTENSIQLMNNQWEAMKVTLMESLLPIIQGVAKFMGGLAKKMQEFASEHPQLMSFLTIVTALLVGVGVVLGGFVAIIAPIITAVTGLAAAFGVAATTVLAVGAGAVAVIAGIAALAAAVYIYWDDICAFLSNEVAYIDKVISDGMNSAWNAVMDFCKNLRKDFAEVFDWLSGKWEWISEILSQPISTTVSAIFTSDKPESNAESNAAGGIYSRGAFLTTFAEKSGESAIPHTPTARNIGLLARTNEIMGNPLGVNPYSVQSDWLNEKWERLSGILSQPISATVSAVFRSDKPEPSAAGGGFNRGSLLSAFAEGNGEPVISRTPTERNLGLLARTSEIERRPSGGDSYSIPINITVNGSADRGTASNIAAEVEAAVRRALANIENQKARVSFA